MFGKIREKRNSWNFLDSALLLACCTVANRRGARGATPYRETGYRETGFKARQFEAANFAVSVSTGLKDCRP
jgi:hypothetical protein